LRQLPLEVAAGGSYFQGMKRILYSTLILFISGSALLSAQTANGPSPQELNENAKVLEGKVQELMDAQGDLRKQIQALSREISDLREKAGKPAGNYASQEEIKRLADAIQEVDRKRQADNEKVLAELSKLAKSLGTTTRTRSEPPKEKVKDTAKPTADDGGTSQKIQKGDQDGFNYKVKSGDTFSSIAKAYRDQGIKIYSADIERANPGVDSKSLKIDQPLFIPAPKDKAKQ
jgi:chaperonin cofactor prefoldin